MGDKLQFNEAKEKHIEMLRQYIPVVARVHGRSHPEFHDLHAIFDGMNQKIKDSGSKPPELKEEFIRLREITNDYTVPNDVCESYEAVYNMLAELDRAYDG